MIIQNLTESRLAKFRQLAKFRPTFIRKRLGIWEFCSGSDCCRQQTWILGRFALEQMRLNVRALNSFPRNFHRGPWQVLRSVPPPVHRVDWQAACFAL